MIFLTSHERTYCPDNLKNNDYHEHPKNYNTLTNLKILEFPENPKSHDLAENIEN